jgi:hypothetical protein
VSVDQRERAALVARRASLALVVGAMETLYGLVFERSLLAWAGLVGTVVLLGVTIVAGRMAWGRDMRFERIGVLSVAVLVLVIIAIYEIGKGLSEMTF